MDEKVFGDLSMPTEFFFDRWRDIEIDGGGGEFGGNEGEGEERKEGEFGETKKRALGF